MRSTSTQAVWAAGVIASRPVRGDRPFGRSPGATGLAKSHGV